MSRYYECANCPNLPNCTNSTTHEYCSKFWVVHSTTGSAKPKTDNYITEEHK